MKKIVFLIIIFFVYIIYNQINYVKIDKNINLIIEKNNTLYSVSKSIYKNNIPMRNVFLVYGKIWLCIHKKYVQYGEYEINKNDTIRTIIKKIGLGKVKYYKIFFPEGVTTKYILDTISKNTILKGQTPTNISEGSLMPNTYNITRLEEKIHLIDIMKSEMDRFLKKEWKNRDPNLPLKTPYQALILASIVEKEVGSSKCDGNEYENISAVFINRLRKNMRLQSSPTVFYGLDIKEIDHNDVNTINRNPTFNELKIKHPYNTYVINGLPPTPICNPSKKAILAVLHPSKIDDLFFISNGHNCHNFSKTFDDHKANIVKYRKVMRQKN